MSADPYPQHNPKVVHHFEWDSDDVTDCGRPTATAQRHTPGHMGTTDMTKVNCPACKQGIHWTDLPVEHDRNTVWGAVGLHSHDCGACVYLDTIEGKRTHDLYFCRGTQDRPTIVARFGSDGPEYFSGLAFASKEPLIALGLVIALKRGLIQYDDALRII